MSKEQERVKIWNTFFKLAWAEAKSLFETSSGITSYDDLQQRTKRIEDFVPQVQRVAEAIMTANPEIED